ncbi:MAG: hypothetical protein F6K18_05260 [Okeania sp. SIO2C2]|uniref:hypothetical protein n=1 Tax=Okeania sp. SIO2C2 TaxID=2607787 RepID=UPI0013BA9CCF|nr:hypothetical protein [Okeania sp. SIO2C2]NEP86277.1 hypothetical protein [Okeania sp. SIO2C2]
MALAILRFQDNDGAKSQFQVDIGTNRFYTYAIGKEELQRSEGFKVLSNPKFTSPLIGPLSESSLGRTILEVPNQQFNRQNRYIQIISFRNQQQEGPAISEIVKIPFISYGNHDLPVISFSQETVMKNHPVDTVPFAYKEVQPVSSAMFLGGLFNAVKAIAAPVLDVVKTVAAPVLDVIKPVAAPLLNVAAPAIGKVADKIIPGSGKIISTAIPSLVDIFAGTDGSPAAILSDPSKLQTIFNNPLVAQKLSSNPQAAQLFGSLLQQLTASAATPQTAQAASAFAVVGNGRVQDSNNSLLSLEQQLIPGTLPQSLSTAKGVSPTSTQYVEQMSVPVSLASCLPSLMPLMDKVMTREMRRMLMDRNIPERKRMGLITNGLMDVTRGFRGVRRNFPDRSFRDRSSRDRSFRDGSFRDSSRFGRHRYDAFSVMETDGNKEVNALVSGLSIGLSAPDPTLDYDRVESVKLEFTEQKTLMMQGRSRLLYSQDQTIAFPLEVETPRRITKGILQIIVKDPNTLEVLIEEKYRLEHITSGSLSVVPKLSPQRLRSLEPNEEYLVCAVLVWEAKSRNTNRKKRLGTSMSQLITLVGEYCFDRIEGTGEVIPLNDVDRFRPYWHKIWEGDFQNQIRHTSLDCKYYYALEPGRTNHARMETVTQIEPTGGSRQAGKLKTGLILSAYRLNELLGQISDYPLLDEAQLTALLSSEFQEQFSHCARDSVEFKGRRGDTVGLWVYPEFKLQRVLLKQVGETNSNGQVLGLVERAVYFPMPAVVHFIGVGN